MYEKITNVEVILPRSAVLENNNFWTEVDIITNENGQTLVDTG